MAASAEVLVHVSEQATAAVSSYSHRISGYLRLVAEPAAQLPPVPVRQPGDASLLPAMSP